MRGRERLEASVCDGWVSNTGATGRDVAVKMRVEERRLRLKRDGFKVVEKKEGFRGGGGGTRIDRCRLSRRLRYLLRPLGGKRRHSGSVPPLAAFHRATCHSLPLHLPRPSIAYPGR